MSNPLCNEERWNQSGSTTTGSTVNGTNLKTDILCILASEPGSQGHVRRRSQVGSLPA